MSLCSEGSRVRRDKDIRRTIDRTAQAAEPMPRLRTCAEIAKIWEARTGQKISRSMVYLELKSAHAKIRRALKKIAH